ncbi:hypothetical protein [Parahaliea aestuarii]|uniref:Uncharacterized protein n=1 Tax=Parahaliea aestuarii TaxID=1852021 RepID=A0A5C8ZMA2_9GAMM|nr:hypothetical protein [Parahaliea aestuarii]TXS89315.1 hypothetical protein FVW59_17510 [Parahaliea aestuarii]
MISTFKTKLRMASVEDRLSHGLGLRPTTAVWMTRMAWDIADQRSINLMAFRGKALLQQCICLLDSSVYHNLLCMAAEDSPRFSTFLADFRSANSAATAHAA